jgi:hypothetical protein
MLLIQTSGSSRFKVDFDNAPVIELFERNFENIQSNSQNTGNPGEIEFEIKVRDDIELSYVDLTISSAGLVGFEDTQNVCSHTHSFVTSGIVSTRPQVD